jgi:hypothetical protein
MRRAPAGKTINLDPPYLASHYFDEDPIQQRRQAMRWLAAVRCNCCQGPEAHLARAVGAAPFADDDPVALRRALPPDERARIDLRSLAAFIVLYGRPRA